MKNFINIRESSSEYGKSLRKIVNDKKLKSISTKDKQTLSKIADMLAKANEGAEKYTVQKGKMQRKVDGKTADKMKKQGWKLIATEEVQEEGLQEEKIAILTSVYKSVKREMDTLMKKHDAYVSDTSRAGTTISSSKPLGAFIKDVQKLIGLKEETEIFFEAFTRKKELVAVAKMDKMLEQSYKAMIEVNDGIVKARRGLDTYVDEIKAGKID